MSACCAGVWQDADVVGAEYLGEALIPVEKLLGGGVFDEWLPLTDPTGKPVGCVGKGSKDIVQAKVHLTIKYRPVGQAVSSQS